MAKNISLLGANYPDVPAVDLPQTGGGTARFVDADTALKIVDKGTVAAGSSKTITLSAAVSYLIITTGGAANRFSFTLAFGRNNNSAIISNIQHGSEVTVEGISPGVKISNSNQTYAINYFIIEVGTTT